MHHRLSIVSLALLALAGPVWASSSIQDLSLLTSAQFLELSTDLSAVVADPPMGSAAPLGLTGFRISLYGRDTRLAHENAWNIASGGSSLSNVPAAGLRLSKGLPFGLDVGGFYMTSPDTHVRMYGGDIRYALIHGGTLSPSLGIRASYARLTGVNQLAFDTRSLDLTLSQELGPFTPFAAWGRIWTQSSPSASTGLPNEDFSHNEFVLGLATTLALVEIDLEGARIAGNNTYSVSLGLNF
ncbi:hypothetical protein B1B_19369 [mine drainage metagenome]|uniref:Uncharacterized protein n=1 Tax=mine drainage metagenome TaxID=410659 RepID=T0Y4T1_9ZZZZ